MQIDGPTLIQRATGYCHLYSENFISHVLNITFKYFDVVSSNLNFETFGLIIKWNMQYNASIYIYLIFIGQNVDIRLREHVRLYVWQ